MPIYSPAHLPILLSLVRLQALTYHSWACAVPTAVATILILMRDMIYAWIVRIIQRKHIVSIRKKKKKKKRRTSQIVRDAQARGGLTQM